METNTPSVVLEVERSVGRIRLNEAGRLNAVDAEMLETMAAGVRDLAARDAIRVITLTGSGRGFCAGANLIRDDGSLLDEATLHAAGSVVRAIVGAPQPVVSLVNGVAAGVGLSLALAADYTLAAESAVFVLAFNRIGHMPDGGATQLVAASIGRARAMRLAMTSARLTAQEAVDAGLIAEVVADDALAQRSAELEAELLGLSRRATQLTKAAINDATLDVEATLSREEAGQSELLLSEDFREGVAAFSEKRPARFTG